MRTTPILSRVIVPLLCTAALGSLPWGLARADTPASASAECPDSAYKKAEVVYLKAVALEKQGKLAEAANQYGKANEICPSPTLAVLQAAVREEVAQKELEKARQLLSNGLEIYKTRTDPMSVKALERGREILKRIEGKLGVSSPVAEPPKKQGGDEGTNELGEKKDGEAKTAPSNESPTADATSGGKIAFVTLTSLAAVSGMVLLGFSVSDWTKASEAAQAYNQTFSATYRNAYQDAAGRLQLTAAVGGALLGSAILAGGIYWIATREPQSPRVGITVSPTSTGVFGLTTVRF